MNDFLKTHKNNIIKATIVLGLAFQGLGIYGSYVVYKKFQYLETLNSIQSTINSRLITNQQAIAQYVLHLERQIKNLGKR